MQISSILELIPAAIGFFLAGVLLITAVMVVFARIKRAIFGARVTHANTGGLRGFLSNFD
jgi:hypothetical protein